jgi:SNF2 family DNA or RNA helicase
VIEPLSHHFEIDSKVYKTSKKESPEEASLKKQVFLNDYEGEYILFKPGVQYGEKLILLHSKEQLFDEQTQEIQQRNASFENNFLEEFKDLHPDFAAQSPRFVLSPQQLIEDEWLLTVSEKMRQQGIEIFGANNLKSFKYNLHKPSLSMGVSSNLDWFDLNIEVKFGKEKVSLKDIRKALVKKSRYVQLSDGSLGILPKKWLDKFSKYFKAGEVKNESIKISNYQFNIIDELHQELETTPQFMIELQNKKQQLQNLETTIEVEPPKNIKANLRPYQVQGLNWLVFLDKNKLGGCLADDMGLGKTLQTIAFLSYLKKHRKSKKPHLVIVPTSLIFNWQKELEKFCPSLKALIYTGPNRKPLFNSFSKFDLVISTYGSLLNDIDFLKDFHFNYVILDESQAIKNPNSKRYKAVRLLQCENRLALTGTPIESNTFDLYAQMNFLNPGLLGSMSHFRKEFSEAIDKGHNEEASALLGQMIHPFLLRRTKEHVATELPEKTETVLYCEMGAEQRKIYDSFKN